ncbi:restriction endonuclease [Sutcliffiella horikoshii]|uniref:restriction endonuclease n=1 Tax=Sutcliffiella horikoshii TaxID=79883 RepID=UPI00203E1740|nr:restriction endonuclease [Sutcliffiella horikoshii]MCM3616155.1 restriction endonuclease [Sutcliffiella horikoshii]
MSKLYTKTALSKKVGWPETTGRGWINHLNKFVPFVKKDNKLYYTNESFQVLRVVKKLNDNGINKSDILDILTISGIPKNEEEIQKVINNYITNKNNYDKEIAATIPTTKEIIIPLLSILSVKKPLTSTMINNSVSDFFRLTDEQRSAVYLNSKDSIFTHRMRSTRYILKSKGYIDEVSKFTYLITDEGLALLSDNEQDINEEINELEKVTDPFDVIQEKVSEIEEDLIIDLIDHLKQAHWRRLETIVVELMTAMGYGDGEVTQRTNDGGLDGIIKEDKLGLDKIYLQAKKWENTVGSPDVMSFSGALDGKGAKKGIFITTSSFSRGALEYADRLEQKKIILIDGKRLAKLMIENNIGVNLKKSYLIKEVDFSYFEGE